MSIPQSTGPHPVVADAMTVSQVCRSLPGSRGNGRISPSTVTRWIMGGCPAVTGKRVKLRATRCGGRWLITPEDLDVFFAELAGSPGPLTTPTPETASKATPNAGRATRAANELARRGA